MKAFYYLPFAILITISCSVVGQQLPDYSLYNNNMLLLNSAYTGVPDGISFSSGYRKQWAGFKGAPTVFSFSGHGYIPKYKVGVGLYGYKFEAGAFKQTTINTSYSYRLQFNKATFNLGLNAGIVQFRTNYAGADLNGINDPTFVNDINQTKFNTGAGAFLYADKYYVGFSAPILITYDNNESTLIKMDQHFLFTGGYLFDVNEKMVLKPNAMLKMVPGAPFVYNVGINAYYTERFGLGVLYKSQQTMAITLDLIFSKSLYVGYAYDLPGSADISSAENGSHELMINYVLPAKGSKPEKVRFY